MLKNENGILKFKNVPFGNQMRYFKIPLCRNFV